MYIVKCFYSFLFLICFFFTQSDCENFIRVLQVLNSQVFVCGTHAAQPVCQFREVCTPPPPLTHPLPSPLSSYFHLDVRGGSVEVSGVGACEMETVVFGVRLPHARQGTSATDRWASGVIAESWVEALARKLILSPTLNLDRKPGSTD